MVGRIIYEYEQGGWNEWHLVFNDGTSGWLSDAQLEYAVSFLANAGPLPAPDRMKRGLQVPMAGRASTQSPHHARRNYRGVQGELPFRVLG